MTDLDINLPITHQLLEEGIDAGLHPGAQIYVSLNGEAVADDGIGESHPDVPMTRDTLNLWMSATKPITAILFAQLCEEDRIQLDTAVFDVLPEFAQSGKTDITFRHILTHTGGFPSEPEGLYGLDWDDAVAAVCQMEIEPDWTPGARAGYHSSTSWYILGEAVSRISSMSFTDLVRRCVFEPCEMSNSWIGIPEDKQEDYGNRIGLMYQTGKSSEPSLIGSRASEIAMVRPSGNGRGPIRELGHFYEMLLKGGEHVIKPETVKHFTSRQREGLFDHTFQHDLDWGLGFMVDSNHYGPTTVPYGFGLHASPSTFGHGGSQSSAAFADPEHNLVVAIVCNGMPGEPRHQRRARNLHTAIYEDLGLT
jgi:CubicO group peptidase (beta-lactamase class C family)